MADEQIRIIMGELEGLTEKVVAGTAMEVHAELVRDTPVDTGWARANWVPNIGSPGNSSDAQEGNVGQAGAAAQAGLARLASYRLSQGAVYVTNNVPYIEPLNAGHSLQAPAGFVEAAVERGLKQAIARLA